MRRNPLGSLIPATILDLVGFAMLLPILPLYAERMGANKWELILVMASYSATQLLAAPVLGRISDSVGRKPVLAFCYAGSVASYILFALAHNIPMLVLSRVINGVTGGNVPLAQAIVSDVTTPEKRTRAMGLIGMSFGLAFILGPAGGAMMYKAYGSAAPGFMAAACSAGALLLSLFVLPETAPRGRHQPAHGPHFEARLVREAFAYPMLGSILLVGLIAGVAFSTFESTFSQFLQHRFHFGPGDVGPVFAMIGVVVAVVQGGLIGPLVRIFGEQRLVAFGTLCMTVALAILPLAPTLTPLLLIAGLFSLGGGALNPSLSGLASRTCPPARLGAMLGVFQSMSSLGRLIGPVWGQYSRGTFGDSFTYRSASALMGLSLVLALRGIVFSRHRLDDVVWDDAAGRAQ